MRGKIIKGIAGFYYVYVNGEGVIECKARGNFRNRKVTPFVGDEVLLEITDSVRKLGNITEVCERQNYLLRPNVSNISQAFLVFAAARPEPALNLLDRLMVHMAVRKVKTCIVFNKCDLISDERKQELSGIYSGCGSEVLFMSTPTETDSALSVSTADTEWDFMFMKSLRFRTM